jgi:hypothetical protein
VKSRFVALLALIGVMLFASVLPASASDAPFLSSLKFAGPNVCMAIGDSGTDAPAMAQQWNLRDNGVIAISAQNNCVTAGYPGNRRFTIDTYVGSTSRCIILTDRTGNAFDPGGDATPVNGYWVYDNNPIIWANRNCYSTFAAMHHYVSAAIGEVMGLAQLNSSSYDSRVVNMTAWSIRNVTVADQYSAAILHRLYFV